MNELLESLLKTLPDLPGVYEMKNEEGETLYVGKAKNLKNRVRSYFHISSSHSVRIQKMVEKVHHIEWTTVSSEWEALVLESNLIKQKRPKFNVLLRDDKNFSYIRVSVQEDFPMITLTRRVVSDGALYFGPKTSASSIRKTIDLLQEILRFRTTPLDLSLDRDGKVVVKNGGNTKYPCLNFHLKKCDAPCIGAISKEDYRQKVIQAVAFLKGDTFLLEQSLQEKMMKYATEGKFEMAAKIRDYLFSLQNISQKQLVSAPTDFSADVIGVHSQYGYVFFHVFVFRQGKVINSETFPFALPQNDNSEEAIQEAVERFLQEYNHYTSESPSSLLLENTYVSDVLEWEEYLKNLFGKKVEILFPQKGDKRKLLDLAHQNAEGYAKRHVASFLKNEEDEEETLKTLQQKLGMSHFPKRIECYDISHFSGEKTYASMVVFENGLPKNKDYRIFSIASLAHREINDFASLEEALRRRLFRLPKRLPEKTKWEKVTRKKDLSLLYPEEIPEGIPEWWALFILEEDGKKMYKETAFWKEKTEIETHYYFPDAFDHSSFFWISPLLLKDADTDCFLHTSFDIEFLNAEKLSDNFWKRPKGLLPDSSFSTVPDIILIDGGKGQLSVTNAVLQSTEYADRITICSLAKEEEVVFVPGNSAPIALAKNSSEGKLLQRLRDEAHRFAITKNRTEREKVAQRSVLDEIKGLGPKTKKQLKQAFGNIVGIANASDEDLLQYVSKPVLQELRKKI